MKNILLIVLTFVIFCPNWAEAQSKSVDNFYRKYKHLEGTINGKLPGILFNAGSRIAKKHVETEKDKKAVELGKSIKKAKMMVIQNAHKVQQEDIKQLIKGMKSESYDEVISIRTGETRINIMMHADDTTINGLMILVGEPDELMMLSIKLKLKLEDINILLELMDDDMDELELETPEEVVPLRA